MLIHFFMCVITSAWKTVWLLCCWLKDKNVFWRENVVACRMCAIQIVWNVTQFLTHVLALLVSAASINLKVICWTAAVNNAFLSGQLTLRFVRPSGKQQWLCLCGKKVASWSLQLPADCRAGTYSHARLTSTQWQPVKAGGLSFYLLIYKVWRSCRPGCQMDPARSLRQGFTPASPLLCQTLQASS